MTTSTLERVRELAPLISKRSEEIEQARRVPADLLAQLVDAGCFRMLVPRDRGGDELRLDEALEVIEALSRADSATGWIVMIATSAPPIFAHLPAATFDMLYAKGPDVIAGGTLAPKGKAIPVDGGYRVTGQWPFGSGSEHCDWLVVHAVVTGDDGAPVMTPAGAPEMRMMLFPQAEVEIVDTWRVLGLRGTGSHDLRLADAFCPADHSCRLFGATPSVSMPANAVPIVSQLGLFVGSVALGIAQGALDEIAAVASGGKSAAMTGAPLAKSPIFRDRLGDADLTLQAARALLFRSARDAFEIAGTRELTLLERARLRSAGAKVTELCTSVVDAAHTLAGSASVYDSSPLQRRLRDIHVVTQHAAATREFYPIVGAVLTGEEVPTARI